MAVEASGSSSKDEVVDMAKNLQKLFVPLAGYADGVSKLQRDASAPPLEQGRAVVAFIAGRISNRIKVPRATKRRSGAELTPLTRSLVQLLRNDVGSCTTQVEAVRLAQRARWLSFVGASFLPPPNEAIVDMDPPSSAGGSSAAPAPKGGGLSARAPRGNLSRTQVCRSTRRCAAGSLTRSSESESAGVVAHAGAAQGRVDWPLAARAQQEKGFFWQHHARQQRRRQQQRQ